MRIACLGWGSLIWQPDGLPLRTAWQPDGPALPLEFARQSNNGRITLVIVNAAAPVNALWAELDADSIDEASRALAEREGCPPRLVGAWTPISPSTSPGAAAIGKWAGTHGLDGVVWTALQAKFMGEDRVPSVEEIVAYLSGLEGKQRALAEEYVRRAPTQIRTRYREELERELGWTPKPEEES